MTRLAHDAAKVLLAVPAFVVAVCALVAAGTAAVLPGGSEFGMSVIGAIGGAFLLVVPAVVVFAGAVAAVRSGVDPRPVRAAVAAAAALVFTGMWALVVSRSDGGAVLAVYAAGTTVVTAAATWAMAGWVLREHGTTATAPPPPPMPPAPPAG